MSATRPPAFDDRFATPIEASRRGAHRARPKPVSAGLPIVAGIIVVLIVVGGVYTVVSGNKSSGSDSKGNAAATALANDDPAATPTATVKATKGAAVAPTSADAEAEPTETASPSASDNAPAGGANVNHGVNLAVLNSVPVQGLALKVKAALEPEGWSVARTDNSRQRNLTTSKIYYGKRADKATAFALKDDLGYGTLVFSSTIATNGIIVVLGQDAVSAN